MNTGQNQNCAISLLLNSSILKNEDMYEFSSLWWNKVHKTQFEIYTIQKTTLPCVAPLYLTVKMYF